MGCGDGPMLTSTQLPMIDDATSSGVGEVNNMADIIYLFNVVVSSVDLFVP